MKRDVWSGEFSAEEQTIEELHEVERLMNLSLLEHRYVSTLN